MKFKKTLSLLLSLSIICAFLIPAGSADAALGMQNFDPNTAEYTYGQFSDVNENAWYGMENQAVVATACSLGLMNGTGAGFSPEGNLTIAQTITMAARLMSIYYDDGYNFVQGDPWYQCYVEYAEENGILYPGEFQGEMNRNATRAEMAYLFYFTLPDDELSAINSVSSLPDVNSSTDYHEEIFFLYNAGILTGNDAYGTFTPTAPITRAAAAAIVSRMALPELRKSFQLQSPHTPAALLDYTHYQAATRPTAINSYNDFIAAWSWMLVNDVFEASFTSDLSCKRSDIEVIQDAALEAFSLYASLDYFDYASFRRQSTILTRYNYDSYGNCYNITFDLSLHNVDGIPDSTIRSQIAQFESTCADIVTSMYASGELTTSMSNKEKAFVLYKYVILNNKYDNSFRYYTAYDAAVRGTSVCQGYAGMYNYLCNLAGVPMLGMTGMAGGDNHAWNRVYENGQYYYIDTTFGDPTPDSPGNYDASWFWLTESELRYGSAPHTLDTDNIVYAGLFSADVPTEIAA